MKKLMILAVLALVLCGCSYHAMMKSNSELKDSKAAYKRCLEQHPNDPSKCESLKRAYHADLKDYQEQIKRTWPFVESGNISVNKD